MELYRKEFARIDEKHTREMVAKAIRHFGSGSNKLASVHISPVTAEQCDGYAMELTQSSDRCIRLTFTKLYARNQVKAMRAEIAQLAKDRLAESIGNSNTEESQAFKAALEALANL